MAIAHQEDVGNHAAVELIPTKNESLNDYAENIKAGAANNTDREKSMSFIEAAKKYPMAIFWSAFFSMSLVMQGFDHSYTTAFYGFPSFKLHYGILQPNGTRTIPASWQTGINDGIIATEIIGLLLVAPLTSKFGYRWTMIAALLMIVAFIFIQFFSDSLPVYLVGELLLGFPWGVFQTITTTYAAEVCPVGLRAYLTIFVTFCWNLGYLIGSCTLRGLLSMDPTSTTPYRIAFALQWFWPIPLTIGCFYAPESPWLLVRKGKRDEAYKAARRLANKKYVTDKEVEDQVAMMIYTDDLEVQAASDRKVSVGSYLELFKGTNLRRTEAVIITYCISNITAPLTGYSIIFLEEAGFPTDKSFDFSIGNYAIDFVAVFLAWVLMERRVSRRLLYLIGVGFACIGMFVIGCLGIPHATNGILYGVAIMLLISNFVSYCGVSCSVYPIVSELPSNALRTKTVGVARAVYNVVGIVNGILIPRMVNTGHAEWGWGPKCAFYFSFWCLLAFVWCYFRLPDGSGRTYTEIDILFESKVSARKFKTTKVNVMEGCIEGEEDARDVRDAVEEKPMV